MEPRIRFAKSSDGLAIAFWTLGEGVPLVHMPWLPWSHAQLEWQNPEMNRWYSELSRECMVVRYDVRGTGLSDRGDPSIDVEAQVRDLEAVVDNLGLDRFVLFSVFHCGPAALTYAVRHPERLAGLVMWCSYAAGEDYFSDKISSIRSLIDDWELYTETGAHAFVGWGAGSSAHEVAVMMRESVDAKVARRFLEEMRDTDCRDLLPLIQVPTLVLHPRQFALMDVELPRRIAAAIPNSRFLTIEGDSLAPTRVNTAAAIQALRDLFDAREPAESGRGRPPAPAAATPPPPLTERELEVLRLVARGRSNREIAESLVLSPRTVERHVANIYTKANVNNRAQITAFALSNGLG